jgi:hypothetical protein
MEREASCAPFASKASNAGEGFLPEPCRDIGTADGHCNSPLLNGGTDGGGTCDNTLTITRQEIETRVLEGLKERLLAPDLVAVFVKASAHNSPIRSS